MYRATSSLTATTGSQPATSGFTRHVMHDATTSFPVVERHRADVDTVVISSSYDDDDLTNDDDDDDDEVTSLGFSSGFYDDDDDADTARSGDAWRPESSSSSSSSRPSFHVDYLDSRLEDNRQQTDTHLKDISRSLATTTSAVRTMFKDLSMSP